MATSISRPIYRARQFFGALNAHISAEEEAEAREFLGEGLYPLFASMSVRDRRHCFDVYSQLKTNSCEDADMLTTALVHDCGKGSLAGAPVRLWHRVAYVLLAAATPGLLERLARRDGGLGTLHRHTEAGAALAREHGAAEAVVNLMLRMDDPGADERAEALRSADDAC